jgi:CHAT domain-containing protein/tetratricopeptide (TPR) repeat protein
MKCISDNLKDPVRYLTVLFQLANRYLWSGRLSEAEPYYTEYFSKISDTSDCSLTNLIVQQACQLAAIARGKGYENFTIYKIEESEKCYQTGLEILDMVPESGRSSPDYRYEQAQLLAALNRHEEAIKIYDFLISQSNNIGPIALHMDRASSFEELRQYENACSDLKRAAHLAREQKDTHRVESAEYKRASLLFSKMGEFKQAQDIAEELIQKTNQEVLRSDLYFLLGGVQKALGKYHKSINSFSAAQHYYDVSGDIRSSNLIKQSIASIRAICRDYDEAIRLYSESAEYFEKNKFYPNEMSAKWGIALANIEKGDIFNGVQNLDNLISRAEQLEEYPLVIRYCNSAAVSLLYTLQHDELAFQYLEKAIGTFTGAPDSLYDYVSALLIQAEYYKKKGCFQECENNLSMAENLSNTPLDHELMAKIFAARADLCSNQNNYATAIQFQTKAIDYYHNGKLQRYEADAQNSLSIIYRNGADYYKTMEKSDITHIYLNKALLFCNKAQNLYREIGATEMDFGMSNMKSLIFASQDNMEAAEAELINLLNRGDFNDTYTEAFTTYFGIGGLKLKKMDYFGAIPFLEKAYAMSEAIRSSLPYGDIRISFQSQETALHDALINSYVQTGDIKRIFKIMEQAKSRVLSEGISLGRIVTPKSLDPVLIKIEDELLRDMRGLIHEGNKIAKMHQKRQELNSIWDEMSLRFGSDPKVQQYLSIRRGNLNYEGLLKTFRENNPDITLLSYYVLKDEIVILVLTPQTVDPVIVQVTVSKEELCARTNEFLEALKNKNPNYSDILDLLSCWLIQPVGKYLPDKGDLIIIPHKFLHSLPFHVLMLDDKSLVENYSLSYVPSVSVFSSIEKRTEGLGSGALIINEEQHELKYCPIEGTYIASLTLSNPVPPERCTTSNLFPLLSTSGIVSFACHAKADNGEVYIKLPGKKGNIYANDIFGISMVADLVSLSCCQTALNKENPGDEQIGLIRAFLYAGAKSVMASLWNINDRAGSLLIMRFYKNLLKDHMTTAKALSEAQRYVKNMTKEELIDEVERIRQLGFEISSDSEQMQSDTHPFSEIWLWAPMALYGAR